MRHTTDTTGVQLNQSSTRSPTPPTPSLSSSLSGRHTDSYDDSHHSDHYLPVMGAMFARHSWSRYHIDSAPVSPLTAHTYWSPYVMVIVSPHHHNHNHYMASTLGQNETSQTSLISAQRISLSGSVPSVASVSSPLLSTLVSPLSSPLPSPSMPSLPSPFASLSLRTPMRGRSSQSLSESNGNTNGDPLPDVVIRTDTRTRVANGHSPARRATSICLPIDAETVRSVAMSLRRISEDFSRSHSRSMLSNSEPGSGDGMVGNMLASVRLSRRSLSSRFRSHYINTNCRQRSFSANDAAEE